MMPRKTMQFLESELTEMEKQESFSRFHIIPCPIEKTVSYGAGTSGGPGAILEASQELERSSLCEQGIYTHPAMDCSVDHKTCLAGLRKQVRMVVEAEKFPVVLGGEHSLSWAVVNGISEALGKKVGVIQVDAHADLRQSYGGDPHSHASVMNLLVQEGHGLASFGVRALCEQEKKFRQDYGVKYWDGEDLVRGNTSRVNLPDDFPQLVYLSFDLDGLDPSVMPAVGTPVPGGLSYYQAIDLVESALAGRKCVGMDLVELAPVDGDVVSPFTAACLLQRLLSLV